MKKFIGLFLMTAWAVPAVWGAPISRDPYIGAIVIDAYDGRVLFEDGADRPGYPASMLKLMDLFIILDQVKAGRLRLDEPVPITKEAMRMGGSQVYLDPRERFTVDELLYALIIQSANDAAMALALHVAGSREAFVEMMNRKARELGLSPLTRFTSPHGLPPGPGQRPDITTPRDFATLCRVLLAAHPETLKYTSATVRELRPEPKQFIMRTHNNLLGKVSGCDGLKTGYFSDAGFSIAATAQRDGARVIAVVMGSVDRKVRDAKATELLTRGLLDARRPPQPQPKAAASESQPAAAEPKVAAPSGPTQEKSAAAAARPAKKTGSKAAAEKQEEKAPAKETPRRRGWLCNLGWALVGAFGATVAVLIIQRRLFVGR